MTHFPHNTMKTHFMRQSDEESYCIKHFKVRQLTTDAFGSNQHNMLINMRNLLLNGMRQCSQLPRLITVVLEDDLIAFLNYNGRGETRMYAKAVDWLMKEFERLIAEFKQFLPSMCKRDNIPHILWIQPSRNINYYNDESRYKLGKQLLEHANKYKNQSALELVQVWEFNNRSLYLTEQRRHTLQGKHLFWKAVDRTIRFCDGNRIKFCKKMPFDQQRQNADTRPTSLYINFCAEETIFK